MRICVVAEGCYPYTPGGVSSWLHGLISGFPEHEFVLMTILSSRSGRAKFVYELPENVTEVHEAYLQDLDWLGEGKRRRKRAALNEREYQALRSLVLNREIQWDTLFDFFQNESVSVNDLLMGDDFYHIVCDASDLYYPQLAFTDYLWTMRSIFLPMLFAMQTKVPEADLYHCTSTGYAGVLGSMGKYLYGGGLMISEHGIYTREREEELIKANWVKGIYKDVWAEQFYKMSSLAYDRADLVTSLYEEARGLQIELGCPEEKTMVTCNGIHVEQYSNLPGKTPEDENAVNVGAIMRIVPIKDVKTLLQAFYLAKQADPPAEALGHGFLGR